MTPKEEQKCCEDCAFLGMGGKDCPCHSQTSTPEVHTYLDETHIVIDRAVNTVHLHRAGNIYKLTIEPHKESDSKFSQISTEGGYTPGPLDRCAWCGMTHAEHDLSRPEGAPVPRVPCGLLVSKFQPVSARNSFAEKPPIQSWEERATKFWGFMETPDDFIDFVRKVRQEQKEELDEFWKKQEMGVATDCWKHGQDTAKGAVEVYRKELLRVIDEFKCDEKRVSIFGEFQAKTYDEKMLVIAVLEELKRTIAGV